MVQTSPEVLKILIISIFALFGLSIVIFALKKGWLKNINIGKGGIIVQAEEQQFQSKSYQRELSEKIIA